MALVVISPKFQIVIPKEIRERMGLKPGQTVSLIDRGETITMVPERPLSELRGILRGASIDDYRDETDRL
jgi:AbrB family looped-hinge helix DNA binding protein